MSEPGSALQTRRSAGAWPLAACAGLLTAAGVAAAVLHAGRLKLEHRLLATPYETVADHADLVRFAAAEARPVFARDCARCHGADMKGRPAIGAPDLTDAASLYGNDVYHVERTILYGVRSGQKRANDITEMPAYGQRGQLSDAEIQTLVQYLLKLNGRPYEAQSAIQGQALYAGKGGCFDCHAGEAKGDSDYGAPDLTANVWDYGGDARSLYNSIYFGRHGVMPSWIGKLSLVQIRALAVYIHAVSRR